MATGLQVADVAKGLDILSTARLSSYRRFFSTTDPYELFGLYRWNEALSANFFKILSLIEVAIRNRFHQSLSSGYGVAGGVGSRDWYEHLQLDTKSREAIRKITHHRRRGAWHARNPVPPPDDVISKLTFGFWPHVLDVQTDTFGRRLDWSTLLPQILVGHRQRNDPTYWRRQAHQDAVYARLDFCNSIRNRIAHHEPVWKLGPLMQEVRDRTYRQQRAQELAAPRTQGEMLDRLNLYYDRLIETLFWMSPELYELHVNSETSIQIRILLTDKAIEHYRGLKQSNTICLEEFRTLRKLKKKFRHLSKQCLPVVIKRNGASKGQWITLPYE